MRGVSPYDGARHAGGIVRLLAEVEARLMQIIVDALKLGIDAPGWQYQQLAQVQIVRQRLLSGVRQVDQQLIDEVRGLVLDAYNNGQALAGHDLAELKLEHVLAPLALTTADRLARDSVDKVRAALYVVPDLLMTTYQQAVTAGVDEVLGGTSTRIQGAQRVLDTLADRGVTGFRDTAGRNWSLDTYAEMAVRTGTGHAAVQGHVDSLAASGRDLIIVSDAPRECPLCRPWERKVLSISGGVAGAIERPSALTGLDVKLHVAGSLEEARAAGFQHPNCRHTISAYTVGVTVTGTPSRDADGYDATQRQRAIERNIRAWKRRRIVALTPVAQQQAQRKVAEWQHALRTHIADNDLTRQSAREQIGRAH